MTHCFAGNAATSCCRQNDIGRRGRELIPDERTSGRRSCLDRYGIPFQVDVSVVRTKVKGRGDEGQEWC